MPSRRPTPTPTPAATDDPLATASFEEAFRRLEELVEAMESDDLPLERLLADNEEGNRLLQRCQDLLAAAEDRLRQVELSPVAPAVPRTLSRGPAAPLDSPTPSAPASSAPLSDDDDIRLF